RSPASPPARARRKQAARCRSRPAAPDHDPAAEAQAPMADVLQAGSAPELEQPRYGEAPPEILDARPEKVADARPAGRDQPSGERQACADVEAPERARRAVRGHAGR